jgi:hypothetical protein
MSLKSLSHILLWYYRKHGPAKLIRLFFESIWWRVNNKSFFYLNDLETMEVDEVLLKRGISVTCYSSMENIPTDDMEQLAKWKGREILARFLRGYFERGCTFWLAKEGDKVVGYDWTKIGGLEGFHGVPICPKDAISFSAETFPEFRGRGFFPVLLCLVFLRLKEAGVSRVYHGTHFKNRSMQRCLAKMKGKRIGAVRIFSFLNWHITIWDKKSLMMDYRQ